MLLAEPSSNAAAGMIGAISSYEGMAVGFFFIGLGEGGTTGSVLGTVKGAAGSGTNCAGSPRGSDGAEGASGGAAGLVSLPMGPSTKGLPARRLDGGAAMPMGSMESGKPIGRSSADSAACSCAVPYSIVKSGIALSTLPVSPFASAVSAAMRGSAAAAVSSGASAKRLSAA